MSRFVRNVSSNYAVAAVHAILLLAMTPLVVDRLGAAHYAVWVIVSTLGYFLGFLDLGLAEAQVRQHARLAAQGALRELPKLHGTVLTLLAGAGALAIALSVAIGVAPSAALLDIPDTAAGNFWALLFLVGAAAAGEMVDTAFDGILEGHQRYDLMNAVDLATTLLDAALVVTVLLLGHGLLALAAIKVVTTLGGMVTKAMLVRRAYPGSFPVLGFDAASWESIRGYTLWNSLNDLATEGTAHLDKLVIPLLLGSTLVTPYSLACLVAAAVFVLAEPITDTFLPIAAHRHGREDHAGLRVLLERGTRLVMTVTVPAAVVVVFFGHDFLDLWIGEEAGGISRWVLWLTSASFLFSTFLWTPLNLLMGAGEVRAVFRASVLEVLLALVLILALTPSLGLAGLALAGLLANVGIGVAWFVPAACRVARADVGRYLTGSLLRPLAAALPACATGVLLSADRGPEPLALLAGAVATGLVALGGTLILGATQRDRLRWLAIARGLVRG